MNEREAAAHPHPPACTCVDCNARRLQRTGGRGGYRRRSPGLWQRLTGLFRR